MKFTKYEEKGDYHWRAYERGGAYKDHCDYLKDMVIEKNVLDIGAGDGLLTYMLGAKGIDNEESAVRIAQGKGVDVTHGSAHTLHFQDDSFEAVVMFDVIEHLEQVELALEEARRVAPVLYISTPERQPGQKVRDKFHIQEWTREELVELLRKNNYQLTGEVSYAKHGDTLYARFERINTGA